MLSTHTLADDIRVVSSGGFAAAYKTLAPEFERQTGNKLLTGWGPSMGTTTNAVPVRLARQEVLDVVIMVGAALDQLMKEGKLLAGSKVKFADSLIACAVNQAGNAKLDISTVPALKQAFLNAKSVAVSDSASGEYIKNELVHKLGIAEQMKAKIKQIPATPVGEMVAHGEAELGCQQYSELLPVAGIRILGNIPDEVQLVTEFSGAIVAASNNAKQGQALLQFLGSPQNAAAIAATGLKPAAKP
jgi:molybdate transport system substrate-binding protein